MCGVFRMAESEREGCIMSESVHLVAPDHTCNRRWCIHSVIAHVSGLHPPTWRSLVFSIQPFVLSFPPNLGLRHRVPRRPNSGFDSPLVALGL